MNLPVPLPFPALEPTTLNDVTQAAISELLREGESRNTLVSYRSALQRIAAQLAFAIRGCHGVVALALQVAGKPLDRGREEGGGREASSAPAL